MTQTTRGPTGRPEISLPVEVLAGLHQAAGEHAGSEPEALLRAAGAAIGPPVLDKVSGSDSTHAGGTSSDDFWAALRDYFSSRGWGTISHERIHAGLGRVRAVDWAESAEEGESPFTAGLLAGLFTALAGQTIEVLEAPRTANEPDLAFLFGSPEAVAGLQRLLDEGVDLSAAVDRL